MRVIFLFLFSAISFSASAQWWKIDFKKQHRYPALVHARPAAFKAAAVKVSYNPAMVRVALGETTYGLTLSERVVMKTAQHNMRFREYAEASYNFRDLAKIYVQLNKLSQAKWFFLQSNNLSRQQNNDRLTIANLINLALVKTAIGDFALAQQDLDEARTLATVRGWQDDLTAVDIEIKNLQQNKLVALKPGNNYVGNTQSAL